jgi:hypothetical protein
VWVREAVIREAHRRTGRSRSRSRRGSGVVEELIDQGLGEVVRSFSGCCSARHVNHIPTAGISHPSWGIPLDVNTRENPFGATQNQDLRLVRTFERWGFVWGGDWLIPDAMHFEYRRLPASG